MDLASSRWTRCGPLPMGTCTVRNDRVPDGEGPTEYLYAVEEDDPAILEVIARWEGG